MMQLAYEPRSGSHFVSKGRPLRQLNAAASHRAQNGWSMTCKRRSLCTSGGASISMQVRRVFPHLKEATVRKYLAEVCDVTKVSPCC